MCRTGRRGCRLRDMIIGQCREKWMSWWDSRKPIVVCGEICGWWQAYFLFEYSNFYVTNVTVCDIIKTIWAKMRYSYLQIEKYIADKITSLCEKRDISKYRLSQISGIFQSSLGRIMAQENLPSLITLEKYVQLWAWHYHSFFRKVIQRIWQKNRKKF